MHVRVGHGGVNRTLESRGEKPRICPYGIDGYTFPREGYLKNGRSREGVPEKKERRKK